MVSSAGTGANVGAENGLDAGCGAGIMGNGLVVNAVGAYSGGNKSEMLLQLVDSSCVWPINRLRVGADLKNCQKTYLSEVS